TATSAFATAALSCATGSGTAARTAGAMQNARSEPPASAAKRGCLRECRTSPAICRFMTIPGGSVLVRAGQWIGVVYMRDAYGAGQVAIEPVPEIGFCDQCVRSRHERLVVQNRVVI